MANAGSLASSSAVEAEVFEQQRLAGLEVAGHLERDVADAVGREGDVLAVGENVLEQLAQAVDDRAKAHGLDGLALGAAEVRAEDDLGLVAQRVLDGGEGLADARVVGDDAVLERGTLKSTRMSTRLSARSRSRIDSLGIANRIYDRRGGSASG